MTVTNRRRSPANCDAKRKATDASSSRRRSKDSRSFSGIMILAPITIIMGSVLFTLSLVTMTVLHITSDMGQDEPLLRKLRTKPEAHEHKNQNEVDRRLVRAETQEGRIKNQPQPVLKDKEENTTEGDDTGGDDTAGDDTEGDDKAGEDEADDDEKEENEAPQQRERFLQNPLKSGQIQPIRWKNDHTMVSVDALRIGLPPELRRELRAMMERSGVVDAARYRLFSDPLAPESITLQNLPHRRGTGSSFFQVHRPGMYDMSDNTWFDPGNEATHEEELAALGRGNFDVVLDALGKFYGKTHLTVYGMGIFALSKCDAGAGIHRDAPGSGVINVLIAVELADGADPELIVASDDESRIGEMKYEYDVGLVIGGDVPHGTIEADYREKKGVLRMVASVYIAEVTDDNIEDLMDESSSLFPLQGDVRWLEAQRGRHWGGGKNMAHDTGRKAFEYHDQDQEYCAEKASIGWCEDGTYAYDMFNECPKACNVYDPKFDIKSESVHSALQ